MVGRSDFTNAVVVSVSEDGELTILSSAFARIFVVDDRTKEEYELVCRDSPSLLHEFVGDSVLSVVHADQELPEDAPVAQSKPALRLVKSD